LNFQQLRSVRETIRQGFNLTTVAAALHTSQPGVSRQIRELEDELGVEIFARAGKRLTGLTAPGESVLPIIERMLQEANNLRRAAEDFASADRGVLTIAAGALFSRCWEHSSRRCRRTRRLSRPRARPRRRRLSCRAARGRALSCCR
jgi:DNA-binding transcriptional LysR family regulator